MASARPLRPEWLVKTERVNLGPLTIGAAQCMPQAPPVSAPIRGDEFSQVSLVRIDDVAIVTWPGEPTTTLGLETRRLAKAAGAREAWVFGLTNDHMAYFTTPDEYAEGGYEACMTFYGPQAGQKVLATIEKLLK